MAEKVWDFELGEEVQDIVTGFKGVVMSRSEFLTGCDRFGVLSRKLTSDGKEHDHQWYDGSRLKATGAKKVVLAEPKKGADKKPGGPSRAGELPPVGARRKP